MKKILITILVSFIVSTSYSNRLLQVKTSSLISKKKYDNAIEKLMDLVDVSHFTALNEIGFALNDLDNSKYYLMALKEDPNHLGALEVFC